MRNLAVDLCVVGAGSAGLSAASIAAQLGARVVLIERGEMGGECLNTGCVPCKAMLAPAKSAHAVRASAPFGIEAAEPRIDIAAVHRHVHEVIAAIAPHDSVERFERLLGVFYAERLVDEQFSNSRATDFWPRRNRRTAQPCHGKDVRAA
jgi:pyruvate/2-oxoglutarate dehydrogenase complex dihydrolipoamide dehydrogenase (E3) component